MPVKLGAKIDVVLPSNASTGYTWVLDKTDAKKLPQQGEPVYTQSKTGMPGAPGILTFRFKAARRSTIPLNFRYVRPWEKSVTPAKVWKVTLKIK